MQYMLLIYDDEKATWKANEQQRGAMFQQYGQFTEGIRKSGAFVAGAPLQASNTATTVRGKNGKAVTTDGPFAETKEQLGGYYLVEAKNLDEALAIAGRIPSVGAGGAVEVRPIMEMGPAPHK
ncbi:MAG TPA: YciI family protein [Candidatus Binatia bacterium]|nr:YciI family protein [Candidatus Binatia bacterium]